MSAQRSVTIVDMGLGNLRSVARAFERAGARVRVSAQPSDLRTADCVVVPGQGAFRDCARALNGALGDSIRDCIARSVPYLGICLGMQMLFEESEEAPGEKGLAIFAGKVVRFPHTDNLKVPHMGWNNVRSSHPLVADGAFYYFVHSYYCVPADGGLVAATVEYGSNVCAAVATENLFACQFHPEKSQDAGATLIAKFLEGPPWN